MGLTDRAKKLAEQAQQKLDEAQQRFKERQAAGTSQAGAGAIRYDEQPAEAAPRSAPHPTEPEAAKQAPAGSEEVDTGERADG